ncbi:MAG: permease [Lacipirellulaceae bacterium]
MDFLLEAWGVTLDLAPWLLVGLAVAGGIHALAPPGFFQRSLRGNAGVVRAVAVGVPLPLCSCAVIPVAVGLKRDGAGTGAAVGFLISTPQTGVDSVLVTASLLGWPLAIWKVVVAVVTGLVGGWLAQDKETDGEETDGEPSEAIAPARLPTIPLTILNQPSTPPAPPSRLRRVGEHANDLLASLWGWLVVGVLISAAISTWLPADALAGLAEYGTLASMGAALCVSLPLYVCATASAPIAAALAHAGLPLGAVLVFLMAGPATNAATILAVLRAFGWRALGVYLGTIVVGSVLGGLAFERLGAAGWFDPSVPDPAHGAHDHTHGAPWQVASAVLLGVWVACLAWRDAARRLAGAVHTHAATP